MRRTMTSLVWVGVLALMMASLGCSSFSDSSESSSDIISSPITSLSDSSGSSSEDDYKDSVSEFTAAHLQAGGDAPGLLREVGRLAEEGGISDWERDPATWSAIGQGLRQAELGEVQFEAWRGQLAGSEEHAQLLDQAFH